MFFELYATSLDYALMTSEALNVISMRLEIISRGGAQARRETRLMVSEKMEAFARAGTDILTGVAPTVVCANVRAVVRANEGRLSELKR